MGVVVFTSAHGPVMACGVGVAAGLGRDVGGGVGASARAEARHPDAASTQAPASAVANNLLTNLTPKLSSRKTDSGRPMPVSPRAPSRPRPAWQFGWSVSCATQITVSRGRPGYSGLVTSQSELDSARLRRDLSLVLRRRLTAYAGVGATALTVVFSLVAATTAPGKTKPAEAPAIEPDPAATSAPATTAPIVTQPSLTPPTDLPLPSQTPPVVISGGS